MNDNSPHISVIDPISPAIERVKQVLFRPFNLGKWFIIGFCAWLALLSEEGGAPNFNFSFNDGDANYTREAGQYFMENLHWIIPLGLAILLLAFAFGIFLLWLSSRGKFMFLYCVATNKAQVGVPWKKYKNQANSLFIFSLIVDIISLLVFAILAVFAVILILPIINSGDATIVALIPMLIGFGIAALLIGITLWIFWTFVHDFVVAIQYLRGCGIKEAGRQFMQTLSGRKGAFALYMLFQIVIGMAISGIIFLIGLVTCCVACCIMAIPVVGTVFLLPLLIFRRSYSLYFLRQFGPDFDVFIPETVVSLPEG